MRSSSPSSSNNPTKVVHVADFFTDAAAGNLPAFSLVDPYTNFSEEDGDISVGEGYAALVINAVMQGPAWEKTALIWVYDEHGGWYDHVPPQPAVKPDNVPPALEPTDVPGAYDYTGFRVPCCVVSARSKKDYVSHQTFDHTSILKLVETKWNLPALTYRDANAHNMLDFFDLKSKRPPFAEPPMLASPKNPFSSSCGPARELTHGRRKSDVSHDLQRAADRDTAPGIGPGHHGPTTRGRADGGPTEEGPTGRSLTNRFGSPPSPAEQIGAAKLWAGTPQRSRYSAGQGRPMLFHFGTSPTDMMRSANGRIASASSSAAVPQRWQRRVRPIDRSELRWRRGRWSPPEWDSLRHQATPAL